MPRRRFRRRIRRRRRTKLYSAVNNTYASLKLNLMYEQTIQANGVTCAWTVPFNLPGQWRTPNNSYGPMASTPSIAPLVFRMFDTYKVLNCKVILYQQAKRFMDYTTSPSSLAGGEVYHHIDYDDGGLLSKTHVLNGGMIPKTLQTTRLFFNMGRKRLAYKGKFNTEPTVIASLPDAAPTNNQSLMPPLSYGSHKFYIEGSVNNEVLCDMIVIWTIRFYSINGIITPFDDSNPEGPDGSGNDP